MSIGSFSIKNPVLINIVIVVIFVLGAFSLQRLPREQFSEVPFFWVNIITPYPGVSGVDIEKTVTIPIENEMQGIDQLKRVQSVTSEGLSVVRVEFNDGISNADFDRLYQDVRTRFGRVRLPDGTLQSLIDDFSSSDFLPVIEVVISGDAPYSVLAQQTNILSDRLKGVREVSGVTAVGLREKQIVVEADRSRLESLGLSIGEIIRAVSLQNVSVPGGAMETPSRTYLLRTLGAVEETEEFGAIIVRRGLTGQGMVRVRDVAEVKEQYNDRGIYARFNGEEAIVLRVAKVARGNSIGVIEGVKNEADRFSETLPPGVQIELTGDSTVQIRQSIGILLNNAAIGLLLLVVILFFFIGLRNALMIGLGIPLTFALTFIILEALGETFNTNTLFGMVLVLGLIVDHGIVITENSYRLEQGGLARREAAIQGVNKVALPVIAATATTVAAFLPLMILPGTIGKFLRVIPLTVSIALIVSTFEALVFIPAHFAEWPGGRKKKSHERKERRFEAVKKAFASLLSRMYKRRRIAFPLMIIVMIASFALVPLLKQDLFSAEDFTLFFVDIELAPGTPVDKTNAVVTEFEKNITPLIGNGEVVSVISSVGLSSGSGGNTSNNNVAQITVDLTERDEGRKRGITEIMDEVREATSYIAGTESVLFRKATNGPPQSPPVSFRIFGDNFNHLTEASAVIREKLQDYPELFNIVDNLEKSSPKLTVRLLPERASALGIDALSLGSFLRDTFEGRTATTFFKNNEEVDVVIKYDSENMDSVFKLDQLLIPTQDGRKVPFSSVAVLEEGEDIGSIKRVDGKREVTIETQAYSNDSLKSINQDIRTLFDTQLKPLYSDLTLTVGGEFAELGNLITQILRVFLIGIFLIYLILGAQFKSYTQPLLILATVPFAFVGVILYLFISGTPFSTTVLYAGVALAGIAVNDSIVLIDFINQLKKEGVELGKAIIEAASTRLRPILLTSLTTIAGLLPTAIGIGGKSVVWGPMASTIVFGLIFSTLTALFIIPILYGLLFDRKRVTKEKHA